MRSIIYPTFKGMRRWANKRGVDVHVDRGCPVPMGVDDVGVILRPGRDSRRRRLLATGIVACMALRLGSKA